MLLKTLIHHSPRLFNATVFSVLHFIRYVVYNIKGKIVLFRINLVHIWRKGHMGCRDRQHICCITAYMLS